MLESKAYITICFFVVCFFFGRRNLFYTHPFCLVFWHASDLDENLHEIREDSTRKTQRYEIIRGRGHEVGESIWIVLYVTCIARLLMHLCKGQRTEIFAPSKAVRRKVRQK